MPSSNRSVVDWGALGEEADLEIPLPVPEGSQPIAPMRFRRIPAGEFVMGARGEDPSEEPRHRVVIPTEFWLGKYVVTQAEWEAVVRVCTPVVGRDGKSQPLKARPCPFTGDRRPVTEVSWDDCVAWCTAWQTFLDRTSPPKWDPAWRIGLPSEAQWEYACRAGSETEYWNGDGEAALREIGWFRGNSGNRSHDVDDPVVPGSPERHPAGLVGMHGNVSEWCADTFDEGAYRKREDRWRADRPWTYTSAAPQELHFPVPVKRGGSMSDSAGDCRSAYRRCRLLLSLQYPGFRVCLVRGPGSSSGGSAAAAGRQAEAAAAAMSGKTAAGAVKKPKAARRTTARKTKREAVRPAPKGRPQQKPAKKKGAGKRRGRGNGPGGVP